MIKGTLTTGEAFNGYSAFNTFYLQQTDMMELVYVQSRDVQH